LNKDGTGLCCCTIFKAAPAMVQPHGLCWNR
jgi:hypothetical protein